MTIYKQVPIEEELPPIGEEVWGLAANDLCTFERQKDNTYLLRGYDRSYRIDPQFWIKSITLPTEEEINKAAESCGSSSKYKSNWVYDEKSVNDGFIEGATHILNLLKQQ